MAKRFTDTGRWDKKWYRELGSKLRDVREFILSKCDHAGIWEIDLETVQYFTGQRVSLADVHRCFKNETIDLGDKLFIPAFLEFQYGNLSHAVKPHHSVIGRLEKIGLFQEYQSYLERVSKGLPNPYLSVEDKEQDKDKEKDKDKEQEKRRFDFEALYKKYPRKLGKSAGIAKAKSTVKTPEDYDRLSAAIDKFNEYHTQAKTEAKFIPYFSTFMSQWADWTESDAGKAEACVDSGGMDWAAFERKHGAMA